MVFFLFLAIVNIKFNTALLCVHCQHLSAPQQELAKNGGQIIMIDPKGGWFISLHLWPVSEDWHECEMWYTFGRWLDVCLLCYCNTCLSCVTPLVRLSLCFLYTYKRQYFSFSLTTNVFSLSKVLNVWIKCKTNTTLTNWWLIVFEIIYVENTSIQSMKSQWKNYNVITDLKLADVAHQTHI